jgi:hypothetical protein
MNVFLIVLVGRVAFRMRFLMILYQPYHALVVLHLIIFHNCHMLLVKQHVICVEGKFMEKFIIANFASLLHILSVQRSEIRWKCSSMITLFIFSFKIITMTSLKLYVIFVKNQCKKVTGCTGVNNAILMCMHFVPSFQGNSKILNIINMSSP